jgi:hypothetical protein
LKKEAQKRIFGGPQQTKGIVNRTILKNRRTRGTRRFRYNANEKNMLRLEREREEKKETTRRLVPED